MDRKEIKSEQSSYMELVDKTAKYYDISTYMALRLLYVLGFFVEMYKAGKADEQ